jgi:purine-nucleoside phosphorylase
MDREKMFEFCFGCESSFFPEKAIISPVFPLKLFSEHCRIISSFKGKMYSGFLAEKNGHSIVVITCGIGDRLLGDAVVLLGQTVCKEMFFLGTCGGFRDTNIGDVIVADSVFPGEGFSRYFSEQFDLETLLVQESMISVDKDGIERLKGFIDGHYPEIKVNTGPVFSIGSLLAEEKDFLMGLEQKGFAGIEMELSAFYCASKNVNINSSGILVVSDMPVEKPLYEFQDKQDKQIYYKTVKDVAKLSIEYIAGKDLYA